MLFAPNQCAELVDLSPSAFADASVNARLEANEEIQHMGNRISYAQNNEIWKQKFTNSQFYRDYNQHLVER
jgi:predicted KAP-like P-loop ATPase